MFSFVSIGMVSLASAQYGGTPSIPQMEEVSGQYVNDDVGVRITFPDGWTGFAMDTPQGKIAAVAPGGMDSPNQSQSMVLAMVERSKPQPKDPSEFSQQDTTCDTPTTKQITVSGAQATETTMQCTSDGEATKVKIVSAQTETHWISVMYQAKVADFDLNVGKFDNSVKTLNILNVESVTVTSPTIVKPPEETTKLEVRDMPVSAGGENVNVKVQSSSSITKFGLDENNKKISFTATDDNDGKTLVGLGSVLKGPYAVTIDGQLAKDYLMADENTIQLTYLAGTHDISISGTQVVPEFPVAVIGVIALVIGMVAILGRTKIFANLTRF